MLDSKIKKGLNIFLPDYRFSKISAINEDILLNSELIIFDIDNTLFFPETTEIKKENLDWFSKINSKHKCLCLSNSFTLKKRGQKISDILGCDIFYSRRKKPLKSLFREIAKKYNLKPDKTIIIGDRIFTDILFGNINGLTTVLVDPLSNKESPMIKIIRKIEKVFLLAIKFLGYN